jgi:hypothetical protein
LGYRQQEVGARDMSERPEPEPPINMDMGYGHVMQFPANTDQDTINSTLQQWEPSTLDKEVWSRAQQRHQGADGEPISSAEFAAKPQLRQKIEDELAGEWGIAGQVGHGLTLGLDTPADAAIGAVQGSGGTFSDRYAALRQPVDAARQAWEKQNPEFALGTDIATTLVPTGMALKGLKYGEEALLKGAPIMQKFLAGQTGGRGALLSVPVAGAKLGAEAGALQSQVNPEESFGQQVATGAAVGTVLSPIAPMLNAFAGRRIERPVAQLASDAKDLGIDLAPKQLRPDVESVTAGKAKDQIKQYNAAGNKLIGSDAEDFTPASFGQAKADLSTRYNAVVPKLSLTPYDRGLITDLGDIQAKAVAKFGPRRAGNSDYNQFNDTLQNIAGELRTAAAVPGRAGTIPGVRFQALTEKGGPIDDLINNQNTKYLGVRLRSALEDSLLRNPANAPADVQEFNLARKQTRLMMALEPVVDDAKATGMIDPKRVQTAIGNKYKEFAWGGVPDDVDAWARVGQLIDSPTATGGVKKAADSFFLGGHHAAAKTMGVAAGTAAASEIIPLVHSHPGAAAVAAATLAASIFGKAAVNAYGQGATYAGRALQPELNRAVPNALLAPAAQGSNKLIGP